MQKNLWAPRAHYVMTEINQWTVARYVDVKWKCRQMYLDWSVKGSIFDLTLLYPHWSDIISSLFYAPPTEVPSLFSFRCSIIFHFNTRHWAVTHYHKHGNNSFYIIYVFSLFYNILTELKHMHVLTKGTWLDF